MEIVNRLAFNMAILLDGIAAGIFIYGMVVNLVENKPFTSKSMIITAYSVLAVSIVLLVIAFN